MTPYLVLSLALLGAEPAADCNCDPQPPSAAPLLPETVPTAAGITDYCYCPKFLESFFTGPNYWVVGKYPPNSGMETDCFSGEEVVIFGTLEYGECDSQCSDPNCWLGGFFLRNDVDGETPTQESRQPEAAPTVANAPSLRLPNKKRVREGAPDFEFPVKLNAHIDFREKSIRSRLVKIADEDGEVFTWLQLFDLSPRTEGRPVQRVGQEIEAPEENADAETIGIDKLTPVTLDPASEKFPGAIVDGYYRLSLPAAENATPKIDAEKPAPSNVYFVRMHSLLPSEQKKRELLPKPTIVVEPEQK